MPQGRVKIKKYQSKQFTAEVINQLIKADESFSGYGLKNRIEYTIEKIILKKNINTVKNNFVNPE